MKILTTLLIVICSLTAFSNPDNEFKKEDLPQYYIVNGDTIGVVLTIPQLQSMDADQQLLALFEKMSIECDSLDSYYVAVINASDEKIKIMGFKITNLEEQNHKKDAMLLNLKEQVAIKQSQLGISELQIGNDAIIIKGLKSDLRKSRIKGVLGWSTAGLVSLGSIITGIYIATR